MGKILLRFEYPAHVSQGVAHVSQGVANSLITLPEQLRPYVGQPFDDMFDRIMEDQA
jgi:hypothetical protein